MRNPVLYYFPIFQALFFFRNQCMYLLLIVYFNLQTASANLFAVDNEEVCPVFS
jgi:hypothetical protein